MAWGEKIKLGLGDAGASLPDVVEQPVELGRGKSFGGGLGEFTANPHQYGKTVRVRDLDGRLWVWGSDISGESGTGIHSLNNDDVTRQLESPQPVAGALADAWISSFNSALPGGIDRRGRVWQWGSNRTGLNGNKIASDQIWPTTVEVPVPMGQFLKLRDHSLAISSDGLELWAWGRVPALAGGQESRLPSSGLVILLLQMLPMITARRCGYWRQVWTAAQSGIWLRRATLHSFWIRWVEYGNGGAPEALTQERLSINQSCLIFRLLPVPGSLGSGLSKVGTPMHFFYRMS